MFYKSWKQIAAGKTLIRSLMNSALSNYTLEKGVVVDLGGGKNPSYMAFLKNPSNTIPCNIDKQHATGAAKSIDFEKDPLPYADESVDQILMFNILEHVYHYAFLVSEVRRILKDGKMVIGFVPFLINYHADPHDYFRYTDEALQEIFIDAGFSEVEIRPLGFGPFSVNFNTLASFMPRVFNALVWPVYFVLDRALLAVRPGIAKRFPLGYLFILKK